MTLEQLAPLLDMPGIEFMSLQKDIRPHDSETLRKRPQVADLGPDLKDFADSKLVDVSFTSSNPDIAAQAANALADEYVTQNLEVKMQGTQIHLG